jgi:hypothetical protein
MQKERYGWRSRDCIWPGELVFLEINSGPAI